jgi:hypothetical protein
MSEKEVLEEKIKEKKSEKEDMRDYVDKNPDFKDKQLVCENCSNPVGTEQEITSGKVKFCRHCGHDKAKEKK